MKARAWLCRIAIALGLVAATVIVAACAGGGSAKFPAVAGSMPAGQSWAGVYYNPVYGYLHLIEKDGSLVGRWRRTDGSHWGELSGTADGNLMHFTWKEHTIGAVGPSGEARGSGVFSYKLPSNSDIAELDGQYALDDSSDIGQWHCVKQNNIPPDIDSVKGDNPDAPVGGHDKWQ